ncbi:MAG: hypothetical protein NT167_17125, partial [Verrucomicrobia bacterium]|nr:hypothetical protein [Verrucomicrobiota bacterium]
MYAHDDDVSDAPLAHEVVCLGVVGDGVAVFDLNGGDLLIDFALVPFSVNMLGRECGFPRELGA